MAIIRDPSSGSLLEIKGAIDFSAPALQLLKSPVTGAPIALPSILEGSFLPRRWSGNIKIIRQASNIVKFEDTVKRIPAVAENLGTLKSENQKPVFDFKLPDSVKNLADELNKQYKIALVVIILLSLVFLTHNVKGIIK